MWLYVWILFRLILQQPSNWIVALYQATIQHVIDLFIFIVFLKVLDHLKMMCTFQHSGLNQSQIPIKQFPLPLHLASSHLGVGCPGSCWGWVVGLDVRVTWPPKGKFFRGKRQTEIWTLFQWITVFLRCINSHYYFADVCVTYWLVG